MTCIYHGSILRFGASANSGVHHGYWIAKSGVCFQKAHADVRGAALLTGPSDHAICYDKEQLPRVGVRRCRNGIQGCAEGILAFRVARYEADSEEFGANLS